MYLNAWWHVRLKRLIDESRAAIREALPRQGRVHYLRTHGNIGDRLINAGARRLLRDVDYVEVDIRDVKDRSGSFALVGGGGGFCHPWHSMTELVAVAERRFERVCVLPSSFDASEPSVARWASVTRAEVFAREPDSVVQLSPYLQPALALDCAFFYDYATYYGSGQGILHAFRTDEESLRHVVPVDNQDISVTAADLDHWLTTISRHEEIHTDRAHVMIAAAMLGKRVRYRPSSYHKVPAIAQFALGEFDVAPIQSDSVT